MISIILCISEAQHIQMQEKYMVNVNNNKKCQQIQIQIQCQQIF